MEGYGSLNGFAANINHIFYKVKWVRIEQLSGRLVKVSNLKKGIYFSKSSL